MEVERIRQIAQGVCEEFHMCRMFPRFSLQYIEGPDWSREYGDEFFLAQCEAQPEYGKARIEINITTALGDDPRNFARTIAHECIHLLNWREEHAADTCARNKAEEEFVRIAIEDTVEIWANHPIIEAVVDRVVNSTEPLDK